MSSVFDGSVWAYGDDTARAAAITAAGHTRITHTPSATFTSRLFITIGILSARAYAHGQAAEIVAELAAGARRGSVAGHCPVRVALGRQPNDCLDERRQRVARQRLAAEDRRLRWLRRRRRDLATGADPRGRVCRTYGRRSEHLVGGWI